MLNLKHLSDEELTKTTEALAGEERKLTTQVLWHLREISRRQLHLTLGYPSLFEYCVRALGFSEGAAGRRISAMRLLKDVPEAEAALLAGRVSLSTLSSVQHFLRREESEGRVRYSAEQKLELVQKMEGKSRREVDQTLVNLSPASALPRERERVLHDDKTLIQFVADRKLLDKLERLKALLAHKNSNPTYAELIGELADLALKKIDPMEQGCRKNAKAVGATPPAKLTPSVAKNTSSSQERPRASASTKREVWRRDEGRCTYQDPKTGKNCGSRFALQIDHVKPVGLGGLTCSSNLRLLCRNHNLHAAVQVYGARKMESYLPGLR